MSQAAIAGALVVVGVVGYIISHEVRKNTGYRSTARNALLALVMSAVMITGGLYWTIHI